MKLLALVLVVAACGKSDSKHEPSLDELAARCDQIAADEQPTLDALVSRVTKLKGNIGHNPGWEAQFRYAQMANDELGLPPFEQLGTPPGRSLPPASLLGIRPYVHQQCPKLAKQGDRHALEFMLQDMRRRYDEGVAHVDELLKPIEAWVASQLGSAGSAQ
jgi:hypothetical protein